MNDRKLGSTTYPYFFFMAASGDHLSGAPSLTPAVTLAKNGGAFAAAAGAVTEVGGAGNGGGWYQLAGHATDRNTLGTLLVKATATGADPSDGRMFVVPWDPFDGNLALAGLAGLTAPAAGALVTVGTAAGQLNPDGSGAVPVAFGTTLPTSPGAGTVGEALKLADTNLNATVSSRSTYAGGAVASVTAPVTVGTNQDKSGYNLAATGWDSIVIFGAGPNPATNPARTARDCLALAALAPVGVLTAVAANGGTLGSVTYANPNVPSQTLATFSVDASSNRTVVTFPNNAS
jgi:hypothetical protein